jgi:enoyl-CoA hydratase/carnithine racemase
MNEVLYSIRDGIAEILINRPEQRNALNPEVFAGLQHAFSQAASDAAARVVTLSGAGDRAFCSGMDLKAALAAGPEAVDRSALRKLLLQIQDCPKPVVALVRGHVMAGGLGLLLACDLALACDDVFFSASEIHVGMFPMMIGALLSRHVGRRKAIELAFLGERVPASEARELGLVNHVFPRAEFDGAAAGFVGKLAEKSAAILSLGKQAMAAVQNRHLAEDLEYMERALARVMAHPDSAEGIRAFVEKRKPRWRN